jgi:hypothetical protein
MPLHILFSLMSALIFYFVSSNRVKAKIDLNLSWIALYKIFEYWKGLSLLFKSMG